MKTIHAIDSSVTIFFRDLLPHTPLFDSLFAFFSLQGLTIIIWLLLFSYFVYRERFDHTARQFLLSFMLSFGATSILVNLILKQLFMRTRPWAYFQLPPGICPTDFSFPSGHASGAFAGAVIFAYFDKKRAWLYYSIAMGISYSRIYLGCHYVLDVLIGALIGIIFGNVVVRVLTWRRII